MYIYICIYIYIYIYKPQVRNVHKLKEKQKHIFSYKYSDVFTNIYRRELHEILSFDKTYMASNKFCFTMKSLVI